MHRKARLLGILIGVIVLVVSWVSGLEQDIKSPTCRLANLGDLVLYPDTISENELTPGGHLFTACLPGSNLAVILRPITESEYGTFQIQAIGIDIIERQMLAAAIVLPFVDESDVAGFTPDLIAFLREQVNAISGFEVFDVINFAPWP